MARERQILPGIAPIGEVDIRRYAGGEFQRIAAIPGLFSNQSGIRSIVYSGISGAGEAYERGDFATADRLTVQHASGFYRAYDPYHGVEEDLIARRLVERGVQAILDGAATARESALAEGTARRLDPNRITTAINNLLATQLAGKGITVDANLGYEGILDQLRYLMTLPTIEERMFMQLFVIGTAARLLEEVRISRGFPSFRPNENLRQALEISSRFAHVIQLANGVHPASYNPQAAYTVQSPIRSTVSAPGGVDINVPDVQVSEFGLAALANL